ncbi:FtsB family cell division protein [Staphylococcus carnosus]|uniref:Cell division protein DivIC n=1 Tax=Staphylococcus carnosus TaxID=1281 RepID=A0AAJ0JN73_STACA|nr:septum formation initiator family protein [Staphylococcus carnosus]KKB24307.1 cell division protein DivIC [Staphylococcus carnosus]POA03702.1 cell division protein DivIC [Staphylococcus carnosus]QQS86139.1 septum formation initiator family protein [Staphylococcus carnosus]QRQ06074.1 septum formation initiator family protein [Staphylococcus carnosus]UTB81930.1 cell division protein DivIC [Staphylococcus carnosus]
MNRKVEHMEKRYIENENRKKKRHEMRKRVVKRRIMLFAGILLAIILILSIMVFTQIRSNADDAKERKAKEEKFQKQQDEEIALKEQLNNLNNKDYIEKIARDDYYLSNDGEVIFKLPKDKGKK